MLVVGAHGDGERVHQAPRAAAALEHVTATGSGGSCVTQPLSPESWLKLDDESCASAEAGSTSSPATIIVTASRTMPTLSPRDGEMQVR